MIHVGKYNLRVMMISQYSSGSTLDSFIIMQNQNLESQTEITKALKSLPELSNELYWSWLEGCSTEHTAVNLRRHRQVLHSSLHAQLLIHTSVVLGLPLGHRMKPASHSRGGCKQFPLGITSPSLTLSGEWRCFHDLMEAFFSQQFKIYSGLFSSNKILQDL